MTHSWHKRACLVLLFSSSAHDSLTSPYLDPFDQFNLRRNLAGVRLRYRRLSVIAGKSWLDIQHHDHRKWTLCQISISAGDNDACGFVLRSWPMLCRHASSNALDFAPLQSTSTSPTCLVANFTTYLSARFVLLAHQNLFSGDVRTFPLRSIRHRAN